LPAACQLVIGIYYLIFQLLLFCTRIVEL